MRWKTPWTKLRQRAKRTAFQSFGCCLGGRCSRWDHELSARRGEVKSNWRGGRRGDLLPSPRERAARRGRGEAALADAADELEKDLRFRSPLLLGRGAEGLANVEAALVDQREGALH